MTDLLERQLASAFDRRAGEVSPGRSDFDDVERRAGRRRRRRAAGAAATTVAALVVVAVVGVVGSVDRRPSDLTTEATEPAVTAPPADGVDRWPSLATSPVREEVAVTTSVGVQPSTGGQGIEVFPYLVAGWPTHDTMTIYGLGGQQWRTTSSWVTPAPETGGQLHLLTGTGFDPGALLTVPNSTGSWSSIDEQRPPAVPPEPGPYDNARPEVLLAAPERAPLDLPVVHAGAFDWVVLPVACAAAAPTCGVVALGGDADHVVLVELTAPTGFDPIPLLASVELRTADQLALAPGVNPPAPGAPVMPYQAPSPAGAAPFLVVRLPIERNDAVWPAEVPGDYCTAYLRWKAIQIAELGAFGTPGWIRWVEAIGAVAPPELVDDYALLASEQAAGHDTSATHPGVDSLGAIVDDGNLRCPG